MDANDLLDVAEWVLSAGSDRLACWPWAGALLIRTALEAGLDRYWQGVNGRVASGSMASQVLVLGAYRGPELAASVGEAWRFLSRAAHHHAYDLSPTVTELRTWHRRVARLIGQLAPQGPVSGQVSLG